jgi:hypothetical protein
MLGWIKHFKQVLFLPDENKKVELSRKKKDILSWFLFLDPCFSSQFQ